MYNSGATAEAVAPLPWISPNRAMHHRRVSSTGSDASFQSALDWYAPNHRRHDHSRSGDGFGSVDWSSQDVTEERGATCGSLGITGTGDEFCMTSNVNSQPPKCHPVVPPLPLQSLRQLKISVEISEHGPNGVQTTSNEVIMGKRGPPPAHIKNQHLADGKPYSQTTLTTRTVVSPRPLRSCTCFGSTFADTQKAVTRESHAPNGRHSRSIQATKAGSHQTLSNRFGKMTSRLWPSKDSKQTQFDSGKGWVRLSLGRKSRKGRNIEKTDTGTQVDAVELRSLCPSKPGTNNKGFTTHGPDLSWIDEDFFDCDENWEAVLTGLSPHGTSDAGVIPSAADAFTPVGTKALIRRARPHRQIASLENLTPVYPPKSSRGDHQESGNDVAILSSRKVGLPGLASIPRADEVGPDVKTIEELKVMNGVWVRDSSKSDDPGPLCDVMELPWIYKRALKISSQAEVEIRDDCVFVRPKLFGIPVPSAATPFSREGKLLPRRDRRKGLSRISLVRTVFGFRQYNCWADPYAGMSIVEIGISDDGRTLTMSTFIKRRAGASCKVATVFKKLR